MHSHCIPVVHATPILSPTLLLLRALSDARVAPHLRQKASQAVSATGGSGSRESWEACSSVNLVDLAGEYEYGVCEVLIQTINMIIGYEKNVLLEIVLKPSNATIQRPAQPTKRKKKKCLPTLIFSWVVVLLRVMPSVWRLGNIERIE